MRPLLMTEDGQGRPHASIGPKVLLGRLGQSFGPWHCPDHTSLRKRIGRTARSWHWDDGEDTVLPTGMALDWAL